MSTCMCLWECHLCVWRSEADFGYILYLTFILDRFFHWTWSRPFQLQGLVTESQPTCFHIFIFQHWLQVQGYTHPAFSIDVRYIKLCLFAFCTANTLHTGPSSQLRKIDVFFNFSFCFQWGVEEILNEWTSEWNVSCWRAYNDVKKSKASDPWENGKAFPSGWGSENWQSFFLVSVQIIVCTENAHCNFLSWMITAQRLLPYYYCSYRD